MTIISERETTGVQRQSKMDAVHEQLLATARKITYRRITLPDDFESVGHLRQRAYDAKDIYCQKFQSNVIEAADFAPNSHVFGLYEQSTLVSTIRLSVVDKDHPNSPATSLFGDVLTPLINQGMSFIDPSRLAINDDAAKDLPGLHLVTMRLAHMATFHFQASYCLALVKREHGAFYRRAFKFTQLAPARDVPGHIVRPALYGGPLSSVPEVSARYPLYGFAPVEPRLLFGVADGYSRPLSVTPTADLMLKVA